MIVQKWVKARQYKEDMIRAEILRISKKDQEARKLEYFESEILKRLRDTHIRQQQAIDEITLIFH